MADPLLYSRFRKSLSRAVVFEQRILQPGHADPRCTTTGSAGCLPAISSRCQFPRAEVVSVQSCVNDYLPH